MKATGIYQTEQHRLEETRKVMDFYGKAVTLYIKVTQK